MDESDTVPARDKNNSCGSRVLIERFLVTSIDGLLERGVD